MSPGAQPPHVASATGMEAEQCDPNAEAQETGSGMPQQVGNAAPQGKGRYFKGNGTRK